MGILDGDVAGLLREYDRRCVHYNLIAEGIYHARDTVPSPFEERFLPYIVAGLIGFDMRRMMGAGDKYSPKGLAFASQLSQKLTLIEPSLANLWACSIDQSDLESASTGISTSYAHLIELGAAGKKFHVGATKILHWIAPKLFIVLDSNVARAFRSRYHVRSGYDCDRYLQCLELAKREISDYGSDRLRALQPGTPLARIFDKVAFMVGSSIREGR
jgi:hypothetical protein